MKKNRYKLLAGCALAVIYSSNVAVAMPVTATDTVTLPGGSVYMSGSGINTYTFDINSYLGSGFTAPYNLSNVSILASFMDDQNDGITRSNESNLGSYAWTSGPDYYGGGTQRRNGTADFTEEQETAGLTAGASSYYSSTSSSAGGTYSQSQSDGSTQAGYHSGSCSWGWCSGGHYHYINKYTDYAGDLTSYNGAFDINFMIDGTAMTDLQADGMLSVDIFSSLGDFNLQSLSLTFTASQNQSVQTTSGTSNQVPEPGTLALLGLGLMGVAGYRRRRRS